MITIAALIAAGIGPAQARQFTPFLVEACARFYIDTPEREAGFIAQAAHESAGFTRLEENLHYTSADRLVRLFRTAYDLDRDGIADHEEVAHAEQYLRNPRALASCIYANRLGNGPEASGDGWRYRGRGLFQLTGRDNYAQAEHGVGRPYLADPGLVAQPRDACLSAAWYWHSRGMNALMDVGRFDEVTRRLNGPAMLGADERLARYHEALGALQELAA